MSALPCAGNEPLENSQPPTPAERSNAGEASESMLEVPITSLVERFSMFAIEVARSKKCFYVFLEEPSETIMTVEDSWGLSTAMPTDGQKLRESVRTLMAQCIQKYGGPENYLRMRFATRAAKQDWLNYLGEIQKVDGATSFNVGVDLPISNCNALSEARLRFGFEMDIC